MTKALVRAVTAEKHRPQYVVGLDARFYMVPVMMLPRRWVRRGGHRDTEAQVGVHQAHAQTPSQHFRACAHRLINRMYDDTTFGRTKPAGAAPRFGEA